MTAKVTFSLGNPTQVKRRELKPGVAFVYEIKKDQLYVVPTEAFVRHPSIGEKDIAVGGQNSGSLDDWRPDGAVIVVDISVTRAAPAGAKA